MAIDKQKKIIIVKKKKVVAGGHHGGSWKVAYADFVTAMMAFFMVMWILGMDENMKKAIEGYFSNPVGYKKGASAGGASPIASGSSPASMMSQQTMRLIVRNYEERQFKQVQERLRQELDGKAGRLAFGARVEVALGSDGLRIELVEGAAGDTFFPSGSAEMTPVARGTLAVIAEDLGDLAHGVIIEGHTDANTLDRADGYSNWELSADRANAARRVLEGAGLGAARVVEVRGLADRHLRDATHPLSGTNRRITILLPYTVLPDGSAARQAPTES